MNFNSTVSLFLLIAFFRESKFALWSLAYMTPLSEKVKGTVTSFIPNEAKAKRNTAIIVNLM
jgi:hypothetical protein